MFSERAAVLRVVAMQIDHHPTLNLLPEGTADEN